LLLWENTTYHKLIEHITYFKFSNHFSFENTGQLLNLRVQEPKTFHKMNKNLNLKEQIIVPSSIKTKILQICGSIKCIYSNWINIALTPKTESTLTWILHI